MQQLHAHAFNAILMTGLSQPRGEMKRGQSIDIRSHFSKKSRQEDEGKPVLTD